MTVTTATCAGRAGLLLAAALSVGCRQQAAAGRSGSHPFTFALIGDQQYDAEDDRRWVHLKASIDRDDAVAFLIHDGDIKTGGTACSDSLLISRQRDFDTFRHPFVLAFGDNEWLDCHRGGAMDPLERLAKLRELFAAGDSSLGRRRLALTRQSAAAGYAPYRENVRWDYGGVVFATLSLPGGDGNGSGPRTRPSIRRGRPRTWRGCARSLGTPRRPVRAAW